MSGVVVGLDLIELDRIERTLRRHPERFRERCFTPLEIAECERKKIPAESYAGRFAAKEAIGKALGVGIEWHWLEVEIAGRGKPRVALTGSMAAAALRRGVRAVDLSMTHSRTTAAAVAVALIGPNPPADRAITG